MRIFFIFLQIILLFCMAFHDWIRVPPLNDISTLKISSSYFYRLIGSIINGVMVCIPLLLTIIYYNQPYIPLHITGTVTVFYLLLTIGAILSWWAPYFFGSSQSHKLQLSKFANTHHFLPPIKDHVVPNTLHVLLHLQVWACLVIAFYFFITKSV